MKISLLLGFLFIIRIQPLVIIGILLGVVIFYALRIYYYSLSFWFGYILILIILSGVLVIFTYVVRLIPNERFEYLRFITMFGILFFIFTDRRFIAMSNQRIIRVLLWEGIISGYLIFLAIFLLRIIIIVIFLRNPEVGALR